MKTAKTASTNKLRASPEASRTGPFILVTDNDGHRYVIPKSQQADWDRWLRIPSDDERAWEPPAYADSVGGLVSFPSYTIE